MTEYTTLEPAKKAKKTVFKKFLTSTLEIKDAKYHPKDYDKVLYIGNNTFYGDVFKAWLDNNEEEFTIYFGEKGDEF